MQEKIPWLPEWLNRSGSKAPKISRTFFFTTLFVAVFSSLAIGIIWINSSFSDMEKEKQNLRKAFIDNNKILAKTQVLDLLRYIEYKKSRTCSDLKHNLKQQTQHIATTLDILMHQQQQLGLAPDAGKLAKTISKLPMHVWTKNTKGFYFFIITPDGKPILTSTSPDAPSLPWGNMENIPINNIKKQLKDNKESFFSYIKGDTPPQKPENCKNHQINFVTVFEPTGWIIGMGRYVEHALDAVKGQVLDHIANLRFENGGYFFVFTSDKKALIYAGKRTNLPQNLPEKLSSQSNQNLFEQMRQVSSAPDGGFLFYNFPKEQIPGKFKKVSFLCQYKEWGWIIGAGIYLDEIDAILAKTNTRLIEKVKANIHKIMLVLALVIITIYIGTRLITQGLEKNASAFLDFFKKAATKSVKINDSAVHFQEFKEIAISANKMIEDRTLAQKENEKSAKRLDLAMEGAGLGLWNLDLIKNDLQLYPKYMTSLGYTQTDLAQRPLSWLRYIHYQDRAEVANAINTLKQKSNIEIEFRIKASNGSYRWILAKGRIMQYTADNRPSQATGTLMDITGRKLGLKKLKATLKQLETAKQTAETASRSKSLFLANMSHEIRTPMNAIIGFSDLLKSESQNEEQKQYLELISSSGKTLLTLINDILDLSKVEAGKLKLEYTVARPHTICNEINQIFQQKAQSKNIALNTSISPQVPSEIILDEGRIRQILLNLIGNAVKFTDQGQVDLDVNFSPDNHNTLTFAIRDTGIGIEAHALEHIFGAFDQHPGQSHVKYGGTGLGLAISKRLAEMMGGTITVESAPGAGSTFTLTLCNLKLPEKTLKTQMPQEDFDPTNINFENASIILADSDTQNLDMLKDYISTYRRMALVRLSSTESIFNCLESSEYDLVIATAALTMDASGKTMQKLEEHLQNTPFICICKNQKQKNTIVHANNTTPDTILLQPVTRAELINTMTQFLAHSSTQNQPLEENMCQSDQITELKNPKELYDILENTFRPKWAQVRDQLTLNEINSFAKDIIKLANEHDFTCMANWGNSIQERAKVFDMAGVTSKLDRFPELVDRIKNFL